MIDNVFYFKSINSIGGVESFFYYLSKLYKNMVVYYEEGDPLQVERLAKNIEVRKFKGEKVKCKRLFGNYGLDNFLPYVEAEEKYFIIHCDYKKTKRLKPLVYPGFKYIAVTPKSLKYSSFSIIPKKSPPKKSLFNTLPFSLGKK